MKLLKILFTAFILTVVFNCSFAQMLVFDPIVMSTLITNHNASNRVLKDIRGHESEIAAWQKAITVELEGIRKVQKKMYNGLKTVTAVISNAKDIVYAVDIADDIGKYQNQMVQIASEHPELMVIALKTEHQLIKRSGDLMDYIYQVAIIGTDFNLMDNKQRLEVIQHVVNELRIMRGIAYSVVRQMRVASLSGIIEELNPFDFSYPDHRREIAETLLDEL